MKPNSGEVEVDLSVDTNSDNYDGQDEEGKINKQVGVFTIVLLKIMD